MDKLKNYLKKTRKFLEEIIDSDFGLIDKLRAKSVLNSREIEAIKATDTFIGRNSLLLDTITKKKKIPELRDALKDTGQQHIVNYLNAYGERSPLFGEDWPLTDNETSIIDGSYDVLTDILDTCELTGLLFSKGTINKRHRDFISSKSTPADKNQALLEIIKRCSLRSYKQTIECLRESKQNYIADILEGGGALVPVHATMKAENLDETETRIVDEMTKLLLQMNVSTEQANRMLIAAQVNIIAVKRGQSIVIYICCRTEDEFNGLCKMIDNSEIKNFLEEIFVALTPNTNLKVLSVKIYESDIEKARQMFKSIELLHLFHSTTVISEIPAEVEIFLMEPTNIKDVPLELIDVIIQKSFAIFIQMKSQTDDEKYQEGFKQLAEVNYVWFKRMTNRRFKNDLWSYVSGICASRNSISTFWKNNLQFIEENVIQLRTEATRLKHQDLLSDIQCAFVARKSSTLKKVQSSDISTDLSLILNCKNETSMNFFIEYLRLSKRRWIAKAMRNYGTSVRLEIKRQSPIEDQKCPIEDKKITSFLKDSGSVSLGSMEDRDFVEWIWCKSSDPRESQQSKYHRHPFCHLVEESPQRIKELNINVGSDHLKKKAVVRQLETINAHVKAVGVTKLRNEFYCLNYYGKTKVFNDQYPFVLLRKFHVKEIEKAVDIVSCEKENALYILEIHKLPHRACVWKIEHISKSTQSQIKWLELPDDFRPSNLSMSKNGHILMVSEKPSPTLRVYGPDAQLHLRGSLHQYIKRPIHAVETSTGNFVILHLFEKKEESTITTMSRDGKAIVHNYQPKNKERRLIGVYYVAFNAGYLSIDSNDRVFVADSHNDRVILLNSDLHWNQILFPNNEGKDEANGKKMPIHPHQLYYDEGKKQLLVYGSHGVEIVFCNKF